MIGPLVIATVWLLAGGGIAAAAFWALINTPESTIFTLALSALLALLIYGTAALTWSGVLLGWAQGWSRSMPRRAGAGLLKFLPPVLLVAGAWWLVGLGQSWLRAHTGEISAWFIATLDWSDVTGLLLALGYAGDWIRAVVVPFLALAWLAHLLRHGWRPLVDRDCLAHALAPLRLLTATAVAILTLWAPAHYGLYWMPAGLPPTWVEPAVAAVKLGAMAAIGALGLALIARLAVALPVASSSPAE